MLPADLEAMECGGCLELVPRLDGEPEASVDGVEPPETSVYHFEQPFPTIDWDTLQIVERQDDEGRLEIIDEDQLFKLLGLRDDAAANKDADDGNESYNVSLDDEGPAVCQSPEVCDTFGAAIPVHDDVPGECCEG